MVASLQPLFAAIDRVKDERDLRSDLVPKVGEHFAATRSGVFFFDQISQLDPNLQKILKVGLSIELNPVALGRTNAEIGTELWITENSVKQALKRMFRKLEVSSRAEMVAQLAAS